MTLSPSPEDAGQRLDRYLAAQLEDVSRSRIQTWLRDGRVRIGGKTAKASAKVLGTETIDVDPEAAPPLNAHPEDIPLTILYEDDDVAAVDKPAGMAVHAGAGMYSGTLVNALLGHYQSLSTGSDPLRPGIVHRLDRFTSGVIVIAKNDAAHACLADQFQTRSVRKIYHALVHGDGNKERGVTERFLRDGITWRRISLDIGRDARNRLRMTTRNPVGPARSALTEYCVEKSAPGYSLLRILLGTGRTHQIRVHLSAAGMPVVGDRLYGAPISPKGLTAPERYYLHAKAISLAHPRTGNPLTITADFPPEFTQALGEAGLY